MMQLNLINPGKKRKTRAKGKKAVKKKGKKRAKTTTKRPSTAKRRAPKRQAPAKSRRRRRSNPGMPGMKGLGKPLLGAAIGLLLTAAVVKKMPKQLDVGASGPSSLVGERWSLPQYGAAVGIAILAPKLADKMIKGSGTGFRSAILALVVAKAVFTEVLPKMPDSFKKYLGADGDIWVDDNGQSWMQQDGRQVALQGIVRETALDGIVNASALDGIVEATALDGEDDGRLSNFDGVHERPVNRTLAAYGLM